MGFISSSPSITITAKLTPVGRQRLISNNNSLITTFSLGDSDANYYSPLPLTTGEIPAQGGDVGPNSSLSNSTIANTGIKTPLIVNGSGSVRKPVEPQSISITSEVVSNGLTTISGSNLSQVVIDRLDYNTDNLVNLFHSFGLPLNSSNVARYTGTTFANGGFSNTALSGLAETKIIAIGVKNTQYGESLDGKTIKLELPTSAGTYTIYSTFQQKGVDLKTEDANIRETSVSSGNLGYNIALLFSDNIMTPNGGSGSLSWATGFGTNKPFSVNAKQLYNLQTNTNTSTSADTIVGVAYLDKGFIVITHPTIVSNYGTAPSTGATLTFDSVSTNVYQNITCFAGRGEFGLSTNTTFSGSDNPRISEIGLYDSIGNLIALGKSDRQIVKNINEFLALGIKIQL